MNTQYQLVTTGGQLNRAIEELSKHHAVGVDTETTELDPYNARLRLIQLATPNGVYIIDVNALTNGDVKRSVGALPLRQLLSSLRPIKMAHHAMFDAKFSTHTLGV